MPAPADLSGTPTPGGLGDEGSDKPPDPPPATGVGIAGPTPPTPEGGSGVASGVGLTTAPPAVGDTVEKPEELIPALQGASPGPWARRGSTPSSSEPVSTPRAWPPISATPAPAAAPAGVDPAVCPPPLTPASKPGPPASTGPASEPTNDIPAPVAVPPGAGPDAPAVHGEKLATGRFWPLEATLAPPAPIGCPERTNWPGPDWPAGTGSTRPALPAPELPDAPETLRGGGPAATGPPPAPAPLPAAKGPLPPQDPTPANSPTPTPGPA